MLAKRADWQAMTEEHLECANPLPPRMQEEDQLAKEDLRGIRRYLFKAAKRRAVPSESLPLELWNLVVAPLRGISEKGRGVGYDPAVKHHQGKQHAYCACGWLQRGLEHIRRSGYTPLRWHRSSGAALKKNATPGPAGKRVVHVLDPLGKSFYSQLVAKRAPAAPSPLDHGFLKHRRKEGALLIQMCAAWRLKEAGYNFVVNNHDLANAFGSSAWPSLEDACAQLLCEEDRHFGIQRIQWTSIGLPLGAGREVLIRPSCGAAMGDPFAVHSFSRAFAPPVRQWQAEARTYNQNSDCLYTRCPVPASPGARLQMTDLSLTKYADDLVKLLAVNQGHTSLADLATLSQNSNNSLDTKLAEAGYRQNLGKQKSIVSFRGRGAIAAKRSLRDGTTSVVGEPVEYAKSLGSMIGTSGAFGKELEVRVAATKAAVYQLGAFWYQKGIPGRWRRTVFTSAVLNTALSGIECFLPTDKQYDILSSLVAQLARKAMHGQASWEGKTHHESLTWRQVLSKWRVAPLHVEALVRRLRWYQSLAAHPGDSTQLLAALFGQARCESQPTVFKG